MSFGDRFFKLKLKITDLKLKAKAAPASFLKTVKSLDRDRLRQAIRETGPLILKMPADLKQWALRKPSGFMRCVLLFSVLSLLFFIAGRRYAFTADDAFITFRYVSNAVKGWGYTFNPPPFEPVDGYTSFLWMILLHGLWIKGFQPPYSADLMTFVFSMGQIGIGFLFFRRMKIQARIQAKSLYLFLTVCLILLTNRTFLAFITSGTEAALFNFLVLWWTYAATSETQTRPFSMCLAAVLLSLCRPEGMVFAAASVLFLIFFMIRKRSVIKCLIALPLPWTAGLYYVWLEKTYGSYIPLSFSSFFRDFFPAFGRDYVLSFVLEYALYFWGFFFLIWAFFKFIILRRDGKAELFLLLLTFSAYVGYYLFVMGGDVLEYRPLSFFIPLSAVAGVKMLAENIVGRFSSVLVIALVYVLISTSIPMTHREMTQDLETRRETTFLYRPVSGKAGWFAFFTKKWDEAQKRLIYQGVGLRHQEHKVLTDLMLQSFPDRTEGSRLPKDSHFTFAWDFVGVPSWVLPEVYIIDLSGRNNKIVALAGFKFPDRRLFGHERNISDGYVRCFGGNSLYVDPFAGKKNAVLSKSFPLTEGKIRGCETFWKTQMDAGTGKAKSLRDGFR